LPILSSLLMEFLGLALFIYFTQTNFKLMI